VITETIIDTPIKVSPEIPFKYVTLHSPLFVFVDRPTLSDNGVFAKYDSDGAFAIGAANRYRLIREDEPVRVIEFVENPKTPLTYGRKLEL
jgi:hypothetical protein